MPRPRKYPPKTPADPAYISEVRRAASAKAVAARRARSINQGRKPKSINVRAATCDKLEAYAASHNKTLTDAATEAIEHGLANLLRD